ncbi:FtsX-like permease family protein [uncultured Arcticibacterium sp.]|uniref:ABC transporter permease n=1 Tax=uncultured Arcticibacterium sp. TaxID=2173042 RepID=UPI0030FC6803
MLKNYLKTAWRNLIRKRSFSLMMLTGPSVGLAFSFIIGSYAWSELQVNQHLKNIDRQFLLKSEWKQEGRSPDFVTPAPLAEALKSQYPHLVANAYTYDGIGVTFQNEDIVYTESVQLGDNILEMYGLKLSQGSAKTALDNPYSMVISEKMALKYFGKTEVLNQTLEVESFSGERRPFRISGVLAKAPYNSVLQLINDELPVLMSKESLRYFGRYESINQWQNLFAVNNIELAKGISPAQLEKPIEDLLSTNTPADISENLSIKLADYKTLYLTDKNGFVQKNINTLLAIALVMLLIGIINFINISLGASSNRLKEIGIRKTLGSNRKQLVFQLLLESCLLSFIAFIIGLIIYQSGKNYYSEVLGKPLVSLFEINAAFFGIAFLFSLLIGVLATLFPALIISKLHVVLAVKNRFQSISGQTNLRRFLIGVQFAMALFVGFGALVVDKQINYFFEKDLGFSQQQMVYLTLPRDWSPKGISKMKTIRADFETLPEVEKGSISYEIPDGKVGMRTAIKKTNSNQSSQVFAESLQTDEAYADTYNLKLLAGRFHKAGSEPNNQIILNETAVKNVGFTTPEDAINQTVYLETYQGDFQIIGVLSDFHFASFHQEIGPLVFMNINNSNIYRYLSLRLSESDFGEAKKSIEAKWQQVFPNSPFIYQTQETNLANLYGSEIRLKKASRLATLLALILVSLGVLGTLSLNVSKRLKELSLRRVLGANYVSVNWLLIKEFVFILLVALSLALPFTYYVLRDWLQNYAFRISMPTMSFVFVVICFLSIIITLAIFQISKALRLNPVEHLKE